MTRYNTKIIIVCLIITIIQLAKSVWLLNTDFSRSASGRFVAIAIKFLQYAIYLHIKMTYPCCRGLNNKKKWPAD